MVRFVSLLKRREGMSYEDFKNYYQSTHSQRRKTLPDIPKTKCVKTERRFMVETAHPIDDATAGTEAPRYDVILEKWYETLEDIQDDMKILGREDVWPIYLEDENQLFDRRYSVCYIVEEIVDK